MRLQSAIFVLEDTLPGHADAGKVLSILKMEGVWMYAVTDLPRAEAEQTLRALGLAEHFRGVLSAQETRCPASDARMYEKALRRLRSTLRDTVVFVGRLEALRNAKAAGFRTVAVRGAADAADWAAMCAEAEEVVDSYSDFLQQP
ncbi:MAG: HAD family hydrolase [Oscillospiraceae bacterium]|nr:HAD family hydrolase [Oscillospiraceae bacterium]